MIISVQKAVEAPGECWDDWKFFLEWGKRIDPENWPWENEKEMVLWRVNELYGMDIPAWQDHLQGSRDPRDARGRHRMSAPGLA